MSDSLNCPYCEEPVLETDDRLPIGGTFPPHAAFMHRECLFRSVMGSVGHLLRTCECFGGTGNGEPEGVTLREGARRAFAEHHKQCKAVNN